MAKTQQERSAKSTAKRQDLDEKELRHRVRLGVRQKLDDLMAWHGIEEQAEAIQNMILNAHAAGPEGSATMLASPRHAFTPSPAVARRLQEAGAREAERLDAAE